MSEESKGSLHKKLEAVEAFIASPGYSDFLFSVNRDIEGCKDNILSRKPISAEDIAELNSFYGKLELAMEYLAFFEDARSTLKDRIDEIDNDAAKRAIDQTED